MCGFFSLKNSSVHWMNEVEFAFIPDDGLAGTNREVYSAMRM